MTKPILAVLDGAKALCAGVQAVFDHPVTPGANSTKFATSSLSCPTTSPGSS
jgi:hypothetical protein